jgi:hypothetical protein
MKGSDIGLHYALVQQLPSDMELISDWLLQCTQTIPDSLCLFWQSTVIYITSITVRARRSVILALAPINDGNYISSSIYREITCSDMHPNSTVHGPCGNRNQDGIEYDTAQCFVYYFWPPSASS